MKFFTLMVFIAFVAIVLFLLFSSEQAKKEFISNVQLALRLLVKAMSIFFDLTMEVLRGLMALGETMLGEVTPTPVTPGPTPTPTPVSVPSTPTPISIEPHPSGKETIKCFGGMFFIIIFISLALGLQQIIRFIAKVFS